jgi:DNA repair protein RadA/Sms
MSPLTRLTHRCLACGALWPERLAICPSCWASGLMLPHGGRPPTALDARPATTTARDLAAAAWTLVEVPALPGLQLARGALVVVAGAPGAGKSTLLLRALSALKGPIVVLLAEERLGPAVGARLHRVGLRRDDVTLVDAASIDQVVALLGETRARVLAIDSVQATTYQPHDLRALVAQQRLDALLTTSQVTKSGDLRGPRTLEHEADVVLHVERVDARCGRVVATKSRFGAVGVEWEVAYG